MLILRRRSARALMAALVIATLCTPGLVHAIHRQSPFLSNCSNFAGGDSSNPGPSLGEPGRVAFESTSDIKGNGSVGSQIYMYLLSPKLDNHGTVQQITNFQGDSHNPVSDSGTDIIAFDSTADPFSVGVSARNVFLWYRDSKSFVQLTRGAADSIKPNLDDKGFAVVFESSAALKTDGAATPYSQVFYYNIANAKPICDLQGCHPDPSRLLQVTNGVGNSASPRITADGRLVFFQSDAPLVGPSNGYKQIFMWDRLNGGAITQITNGTGDSMNPAPDSTGRFVAFQSTADLLGNGSSGSEIFWYDLERQMLWQITNGPGDSVLPVVAHDALGVSFLSTGDLLGTGATGQHVFWYDPRTNRLLQVTRQAGSVSEHAWAAGNFVAFDTDEDIMNVGMTGRNVYVMDTWGRVPKSALAQKTMLLQPSGQMILKFSDRDARSEAKVTILASGSSFPPMTVPGYGTACIRPTADATGVLSCNGGRPGGDLVVAQDHLTDDVDPTCVYGCREGQPCHPPVPSPHSNACPACIGNVCVGGPNAGQACSSDPTCLGNIQCSNGRYGVCNGPVQVDYTGTYEAGGMQVTVPVSVALSRSVGLDGKYCTSDDTYVFQNYATSLALTTGSVYGAILDADGSPGGSFTMTDTGHPFDCLRLEQANFQDVVLVGALPLLDAPTSPPGIQDTILDVRVTPFAGKPYVPCTSMGCKILTWCDTSADCNDSNVCNGQETCVNNYCIPGTPILCDDGNMCNGEEQCDSLLGCVAGPAPNCDDGAACTADSCDVVAGACVHTPIPGCCISDADCINNDVCDGQERCSAGTCIPGVPVQCDDGNACNGVETCDPTAGCQAGAPLTCADGARCTVDTCDPLVGCVHTSVPGCCSTDADCHDINVCNGSETCVNHDCVAGTSLACDDGSVCTGLETCDPTSGCIAGTPLSCLDDGAVCTAEVCDPTLGCRHLSVSGCCTSDADCIDNDACNGTETCVAGDCVPGTPLLCDDGNVCNGVETCDPNLGCQAGTPATCVDDGALCTDDTCDPVQGCLHTPIPGCCQSDADCLDNTMCNGRERCINGDCVAGVPLFCDDGDACNGQETCDPTQGCVAGSSPVSTDPYSYEAIKCLIDQIDAAINAASTTELGGLARAGRLYKTMVKIKKRWNYLAPRNDGVVLRTSTNATAVIKRLRLAAKALRLGVPAVADPIREMVLKAIVNTQHFRVAATQPSV